MNKTYTGSCHCQAIQFECDVDLDAGTSRCNCTFCTKARFWLTIVKPEAFRLLRGDDALTDYQHAPPQKPAPFLHFYFCRVCGVRPFTKGGFLPSLGSEFYAINVATLDLPDAELAAIPIRYVDGRHDDWSRPPADHRHL